MEINNKEIRINKIGDVEYITFNILDKYEDKIKYGFFLRNGGKSSGIYSSLNVRSVGNDSKENVEENLKIIQNTLGIEKLYKASQKHTKNVLVIDNSNKEDYEIAKHNDEGIDAYITNEKNIATLITTADCNPIMIYDPVNNVIANIHSGWKGTIQRIYLEALKKMEKVYNTNPKDVIVCVGPSIEKCCFSSEDEEFKQYFVNNWSNFDEKEYIYYEENSKRFHIDLLYLIKRDLTQNGVLEDNIKFANICTCCNEDICFSYRRATKNNEEDYATQGSVIMLK